MSRSREVPQFIREIVGCWLNERCRTEVILRFPRLSQWLGMSWIDLCNRHEQLDIDSRTGGRICQWQDSSQLTVARCFPDVGGQLLRHVLADWPVRFNKQAAKPDIAPDVSLIVGVRGQGRLPQFRCCLESLRAQVGVTCEIIVVEQSWEPEIGPILPGDIRYLHLQATDPVMPFNRSWALNAGVRIASGPVVVLLDADMLIPERFCASIIKPMRRLDAMRLSRLIFYLDKPTSKVVQQSYEFPEHLQVGTIVQNAPNPLAIKRDVYLDIGGHDETFYGWGAEDNEFMDRLQTTNLSEGAFLPIVHLWHEVAPNRGGDRNAVLLARIRTKSPQHRIKELVNRPFGESTPSTEWDPPHIPVASAAR